MENVKVSSLKRKRPSAAAKQKSLLHAQNSTYNIDGRSFIVEPVFKQDASDTLGAVLVRLMKSDIDEA